MRKVIQCLLLAIAGMVATGCSSCKSENKEQEAKTEVASLDVEHVVSTDREYMFSHYQRDYRWFETCIVMEDFMDEDPSGRVDGVSNVFQVAEKSSGGYDTHVILIAHTANGDTIDERHGFWVEDFPLNEEEMKVTFDQAFARAMAANYLKPHSRQCVLRKEVGPVKANAQYIFGNARAQLYVDALTGEVSDVNPAFGAFGKPLGEWP